MGGFLVALPRRGEISADLVARAVKESEPRSPDGVGHVMTPDGVLLVQCHFATTPEEVGERLPLVDKTGKVFLVKQGFLANIEQLRARLRDHFGDRVPMHSDAEVMMASYLAWGPAMVERLVGEFVLCIWDGRKKRLFAVRDHLGSHPVLMHTSDEFVLLGSEPRQLLPFPTVSTDMDEYVVADYISGYPQEMRRFFFKDMVRMLPAETVTVDRDGEPQMRQYWRPRVNNTPSDEPPEKFAPMVFELFEEAVRSRMRSATPIACQLSGGLDSSSVLGMAERIRRTDPDKYPALHAYSFLYPGLECDESEYIQAVLEMWPVPWTGIRWDATPLHERRESLARDVLLPVACFARTSADEESWLDSCRSRVVIGGQGGDELFFPGGLPLTVLSRNLAGLRQVFGDRSVTPRELLRRTRQEVLRPMVPRRILNRYLALKGATPAPGILSTKAAGLIKTNASVGAAATPMESLTIQGVWSPIGQSDATGSSAVAQRQARSMRFPLSDVRVIDFVVSLPPTVHVRGGTRALQRASFGSLMPPRVLARSGKAEFTAPVRQEHDWVRRSQLGSDIQGLVVPERVDDLLDSANGALREDASGVRLFQVLVLRAVTEWQLILRSGSTDSSTVM